jgi:hypothetical protein
MEEAPIQEEKTKKKKKKTKEEGERRGDIQKI